MTGKELRRRRVALGMTQTELAERLWNDPARQAHIARWENDSIRITQARSEWLDTRLRSLEGRAAGPRKAG
jgi:transcriptional regulator with XRE-family HTH domain